MDEPIRVLHVDDEPEFADMAATFLERIDSRITVVTEHSASAGLDRLAETDVDCIVSDYEMPNRTGIEFLETLRDNDETLPFVLFTGKGSEDIASEAISAGVTDYLQKKSGTDQFELLANRITNAVTQHRVERRVTKQERILELLREINRALVQATTRAEIGHAVAEIVTADDYRLAWFGRYDANRNRVVPRTVAGVDEEAVAPTSLPDAPTDDGVVLDAIQTGELAVTRRRDSTLAVWTDDESPVEYAAAAVVPIVYHDDRLGLLVLYADRPDQFDDAERGMLDEVGGDIAQALHTAETHRRLRRHQTAVEAVPEGVFLLDENATIVLTNESAAALLDRSPEAVEGEAFPTLVEEGIFDEGIVDWYLDGLREMLSSDTDREEAWYETEISPLESDPRVVEIHLTLRPFDEEFRGTVGVIRDVTERKRREHQPEENRER
jgi:PAS domain S-box-containing protein